MTDQWLPPSPNPPPAPPDPSNPLPPANSWTDVAGCTVGPNQPSITYGVVVTGVPATIVAPNAWGITLNDGSGPPNFSIDHYDATNTLINSPVEIAGSNGVITFNTEVMATANLTANAMLVTPGNLIVPDVSQFVLGGGQMSWVLQTNGTGSLSWAAPPIAADAPSDGYLYGRSNGAWYSGGTINGVLMVQGANSFALVATAGNPTSIFGGKGTAASPNWRWQLTLGNGEAETGGNAGSNFALSSISDSNSILATPLFINRSTGGATLQGPTQIIGPLGNTPTLGLVKGPGSGVAMIVGQSTAGPPRWQMYLADFSGEIGGNAGSNFTLQNCADNGAVLGTPLTISRQTGAATFGYGVAITGNLVGGNAQFTGQLVLSTGPSQLQMSGGVAGDVLTTNGLGGLSWVPPAGAPGGSVSEAPVDGTTYGRNDATWVNVLASSGGTLSGALTISAGGLTVSGGTTTVGALTVNGTAGLSSATVSGVMLFMGASPTLSNPPTTVNQVTNKGYVDGLAGTTLPLADGTAAVGTGTTWARADHVHPTDTHAMGDNRIINGNFAVNQRGQVSGTALAAAAYGHDRWKAGAAGCTYTFTAALPDTTITITAGSLTQIIEAGVIEGGVYTLSWTGTAQARVYQGTPTGAYAASPVTTASLPAGVNTIVEFNTGTAVRVKLEIGSVATPYNRQSLAKSMADCQRYYQKLGGSAGGADIVLEGYAGAVSIPLGITIGISAMRAAPTATIVGVWNSVSVSAPNVFPGTSTIGMNVTSTGVGSCTFFTKDATTYITLSAEL